MINLFSQTVSSLLSPIRWQTILQSRLLFFFPSLDVLQAPGTSPLVREDYANFSTEVCHSDYSPIPLHINIINIDFFFLCSSFSLPPDLQGTPQFGRSPQGTGRRTGHPTPAETPRRDCKEGCLCCYIIFPIRLTWTRRSPISPRR